MSRVYAPEDFGDDDNIGIKLGKGIADVDLDCPEAVACARMLMPETRTHGRPGKPVSHYWFKCATESRTYKDLDGTMLLEIRSAPNLQTVVPPSIHPSGEPLTWDHDRPMMAPSPAELLLPTNATAIATIFARHWPSGNRHYAAGHVAGFLLRLGFDGPWTIQIIRTICSVAATEDIRELNDRLAIARSTVERHARGEKTTGGPKLAELFGRGKELVARIYSWMGLEGEEELDYLNERHFAVVLGRECVVGVEVEKEAPYFIDYEEMRKLYYNRYCRVGKKQVKLGEWWLSHRDRRQYRRVVFAPPPLACHPEDYNTWKGFAVVPDPNPNPELRCVRYLEHLYKVICNSDHRHFMFLLDALALTVQFPGVPNEIAIVMRGDPAAGKGTFVKLFGKLFGIHYVQVDKQLHLTGNFNEHLSGKVVVFADEAIWAGNKQEIGALRRMITEETITIERKHRNAADEPNCMHLFMATNEEWVAPVSFRERRMFVLDVEKKVFATQDYFGAIRAEWANGGAEAFLAYLLARKVEGNRLGPLPGTKALEEQQKLGLDPFHLWWHEKLSECEFRLGDGWPDHVAVHDLYMNYQQTCDRIASRQRRLSQTQFSTAMHKLVPMAVRTRKNVPVNIGTLTQPNHVTKFAWCLKMPTVGACREVFDRITGLDYTWPAVAETQLALQDESNDPV